MKTLVWQARQNATKRPEQQSIACSHTTTASTEFTTEADQRRSIQAGLELKVPVNFPDCR